MSDNMKKLEEMNDKAESKTDAVLSKLLNFQYSWIVIFAVIVASVFVGYSLK